MTCPQCLKRLEEPLPNFCPACGEDIRGLSPEAETLSGSWSGRVIDGRYRLKEKLGEGGMGSVFKVEHVRMGKLLALKILRPDLAIDKKLKSRFHQEARLVSKLSHPNTIQVFDFGELDDGSLYIAMEYLPGRDLSWTLRAPGAFSEARSVAIGIQVLASLEEAHEHGIIHRDIKPANVMLMKRKESIERIKVLDFGIAKLNESEARQHITGISDFIGTPAYMSPEQAKGEDLDARSDLYSVGALLFELVTGRGPFVGPTPMSVVTQHMMQEPPRLGDVAPDKTFSPAFEQVVRRALAKDRKARFPNAGAMREALEQARYGVGSLSHEFTPVPFESGEMARREDFDRFERSLRLRRTATPLLVLVLLAAIGSGGIQYFRGRKATPLTVEEEPNNEPSEANLIALNQPVRGKIGAPLTETQSDRDIFVVEIPSAMPVTIEVTAVPDMNLVMEVSQTDGKNRRVQFVDDAPEGFPERVDAFAATAGKLYVRVEEHFFYAESRRPPRETTRSEYVLSVRPTQVTGLVEVEPNDTLTLATRVGFSQPVTAFTGAPVPYDATTSQLTFSTVDYFAAASDPHGSEPVSAIVVPPLQGKLAVIDAAEFEAWSAKLAQGGHPTLPPVFTVAGKPELVSLAPLPSGPALRVQTVAGEAGAAYYVAFVHGQEHGFDSALRLARLLDESGAPLSGETVLHLAERAYPRSPQAPDVQAALASRAPRTAP